MICFTYQWKFIKTTCWNIILPWKTHSTSPVFAPSAKRHLAQKGAELDKHQQKNQECLWINPIGSKKAPKTPIFFYWWCLFVCCSIHGDIFMIFGPEASLKLEGMNSGKWIQIPGPGPSRCSRRKDVPFPFLFPKGTETYPQESAKISPKASSNAVVCYPLTLSIVPHAESHKRWRRAGAVVVVLLWPLYLQTPSVWLWHHCATKERNWSPEKVQQKMTGISNSRFDRFPPDKFRAILTNRDANIKGNSFCPVLGLIANKCCRFFFTIFSPPNPTMDWSPFTTRDCRWVKISDLNLTHWPTLSFCTSARHGRLMPSDWRPGDLRCAKFKSGFISTLLGAAHHASWKPIQI